MYYMVEILNVYELYDPITTHVTFDAPPIPTGLDEKTEWWNEHVHDLTGTGRPEGDSTYYVEVIECDDPQFVGYEWSWG